MSADALEVLEGVEFRRLLMKAPTYEGGRLT